MRKIQKLLKKSRSGIQKTFREGASVTWFLLKEKINRRKNNISDYERWIEQNEKNIETTKELKYNPLISVVIPVYNVPDQMLIECIESVRKQTYQNWQLCMADDHSSWESMRTILKEYEAKDSRVKVVYREKNGHISRATNSAIGLAEGDFIAFMDCDDLLPVNALYEVALKLNENPQYDFIYTDEDKIDEKGQHRWDPHFKPDWSPDTLMAMMYTSHLGVYRTDIVKDLGGLRVGFEGSQDYDFTLRFVEKTDNSRIAHIPKVLYHWRQREGSTAVTPEAKPYVFKASKKAKEETLIRRGLTGKVEFIPEAYQFQVIYESIRKPEISIIIPSKDNFEIYKRCVESLVKITAYKNYEIIHVDNGSSPENKDKYCKLNNKYNIKYDYKKIDFNFSQMCNLGVNNAQGEYYLFLNDDIEVINPDWLDKMIGQAELSHIGAVGAKLYYPNGKLIQHCGVINIDAGPSHSFSGYEDNQIYYYGRNIFNYDVAAVTGACLLLSKEKFWEVDQFDETLPVAYNDVDLCFKLIEKGYYNVIRNDIILYHHESVSRGYDNKNSEKMKRLIRERTKLYEKHPDFVHWDPFYSPNLTSYDVDCSLNLQSEVRYNEIRRITEIDRYPIDAHIIAGFDCIRKREFLFLQGYAYFENKTYNNHRKVQLILESKNGKWLVDTSKIYRPDLQNMLGTDKYINLCGFNCYIDINKIKKQKYDIKVWLDGKSTKIIEQIQI